MAISLPSRLFTNPWLAVVPFLLVFSYGLIGSLDYPLHDFGNSYFAAYLFLHGPWDLSLFDPGKFNQAVYDAGFHSQFLSFHPNPPSVALIFAPLVFFPPFVAKCIWNVGGMLFFSFSLFRLTRLLNISFLYLAIIPLLFWKPILNNLLYGQSYLVIVALLSEGYISHVKGRHWQSGLLWSLAIFIKLFPIAILFYLVLKKEFKSVVYLGVTFGLFFGGCLFFQGIDVWVYFLTESLGKSFIGQVSMPYVIPYQSFVTFFQVAFVKSQLHNPNPIIDSPWIAFYFTHLVKIILLVLSAILVVKSNSRDSFGVFMLFMLLFLPHGSTYSLVLLIFTLLCSVSISNKKNKWLLIIFLGLISNIGIHHFQFLPEWCQFPRLFGMSVLFIILVFSHVPKPNGYWILFLLLPLFLLPLKPNTFQWKESEWLAPKDHLLILDLYSKEGKLGYAFWSQNARQQVNLDKDATNSSDLKVMNNQIYFRNIQKTTTLSQKKCPLLLKDRIVFLSDCQNGIGFFTLWTVPL